MSSKQKINELVTHWREVGPVAWAEGVHGWIGIDGQPLTLAPWQKAVLESWWRRRESATTLCVSNIKKTGKTLLNGVLLCWRWLTLPGEHFAVANDMDQAAGRQFLEISDMVRRNAYLRANVKVTNKQLTFLPTGSTVTALPVDAAGNAGANHLTASHTEAWGIYHANGVRAYEELTPPPGRFFGLPTLRICDSYAGFEAESDTWHGLVDRGIAGERVTEEWPLFMNGGLLLFHMGGEAARERCFRGTPEEAETYYRDQRASLRDGAYLRFHENKRASGSEQFIDLESWDACVDPEHRPILSDYSLRLLVGVDASVKHDQSAVVAVHYDQAAGLVVLVRHRVWHPTAAEPLDLDATIGDFLRELKASYYVSEVRYDPFQMHDLSTRLVSEGLPMVEFPQSVPNLTRMGENLTELVKGGNLKLYPDEGMRRALSHTVAVRTARGYRIAKEKSAHKIDVIIALAMASLAAVDSPGLSWWLA